MLTTMCSTFDDLIFYTPRSSDNNKLNLNIHKFCVFLSHLIIQFHSLFMNIPFCNEMSKFWAHLKIEQFIKNSRKDSTTWCEDIIKIWKVPFDLCRRPKYLIWRNKSAVISVES